MITINNEIIQGIPTLHVVDQELHNKKLPLLIFIHGFTSAKEHNLHIAYLFAEKGYRVLLPDTLHHGERYSGISEKEFQLSFWNIVIQTIHEIGQISNNFIEKNLVDDRKISVAGTSMGGIVTLGAITQYSWISAAVSLMGCPSYQAFTNDLIHNKLDQTDIKIPKDELEKILKTLAKYDLTLQKDTIKDRPIMFWHSKSDPVVPFKYAWELYEDLKDKQHDVAFFVDEKAGHKVTRQAVLQMVNWLTQKL